MNLRLVLKYIGFIMQIEGVFMIPAAVVGLIHGETLTAQSFFLIAAAIGLSGFLLSRIKADDSISMSEGFVICALGWVVMSFFGALPFYYSRQIPSLLDCWFETVSGFTTTGSSILTAVEGMTFGCLYWRSFTHWIGGMGVLVFLLAVVPLSKGSGGPFNLMRAESPGPAVGKLTPKLSETAKITYLIYLGLTVLEMLFLLAGGMPFFDALVNSFATAGTGGFAIKNASIAAYESQYLQMTIAVFMSLFGVNFSVYYLLITKHFKEAFTNEEFRWYWIILLGGTVLIGLNIMPLYAGQIGQGFRDSFFSVSSVMTTTGFCTADFDTWPDFSRFMLLFIMCIGASAGSTGGGMKVSRALLLFKHLRMQMKQMVRPKSVNIVRLDGRRVEDTVMFGTTAFFAAYLLIIVTSVLIVSLDEKDMMTTLSAVIATFNNIGPGFGMVGPTGNFSHFSDLSKFVMSLDMLFGRLEIFPILFLLSPGTWTQKRVKGSRTVSLLSVRERWTDEGK